MARRFNARYPRRTTGSRGPNQAEKRQPSFPTPSTALQALAQQVSGILQGVTVEVGAPSDAIYIDAAGNIGFGGDPGATNYFQALGTGSTVARFDKTDDNANIIQIDAGSTADQNVGVRLQQQGTSKWTLFAHSGGNFRLFNDANVVTPIQIEPAAPTASFHMDAAGDIGYGTASPAATAKAEWVSTTKGILPPRMTTTQRDAISSPAEGLVIHDTTADFLNVYANGAWMPLCPQGNSFTEEAASRSIGTSETAFVTLAGLSFPGPTDGQAKYLVNWASSVNTASGSINCGIRVRMGTAGTTADTVVDYKLQLLQNIGSEEYTINGCVVVTPAASELLTLTHVVSGGSATAVVNADKRGTVVSITRVG
jgi:hypothetical protein